MTRTVDRHHLLCVQGMFLIDQDFARMLLALSAASPDLLMPLYTVNGETYARPCRECNPDWYVPDSWQVVTDLDALRKWAENADGS